MAELLPLNGHPFTLKWTVAGMNRIMTDVHRTGFHLNVLHVKGRQVRNAFHSFETVFFFVFVFCLFFF